MSVNLIIQSSSPSPNFFQMIGLTNSSLNRRVSRAALDNLLFDVPNDSYTVNVSQAVFDTMRGEHATMTKTEWINLKFLATAFNMPTFVTQANSNINTPEFVVRDLASPPDLPIPTKQWTLKLIPRSDSSEYDIIRFLMQYKENITHIDFSFEIKDHILVAIVEYCKNVEYLKLIGTKLSLFQNFSTLTKLTHFEIHWCPVAPDFTDMPQLTSLKYSPPTDQVAALDLTPLHNLEHLDLFGDIRTDITHLKKLISLKIKCFENSCPPDLTIFPGLTTLNISLYDQPLPLLNAPAIETLTLGSSQQITDINFLSDFVNLKNLRIEYCQRLEDVSVISRFIHLTSLSFFSCNDLVEIPDLHFHVNLKSLELEVLRNLNQLPRVTESTTVKANSRNLIRIPDEINEYKKRLDPLCTSVGITTVSPYSLLHLEDLPNLTSFTCYFPIVIRKIFLSRLGNCEKLSLLNSKETHALSIIDSPAVKKIVFHAKDLTHLQLIDLPQLKELTIKECPVIATMALPAFVIREGNDVLKFRESPNNSFLETLTTQILRYNQLKEVVEKRNWKLFYSMMQGADFIEYVKILYLHFRPFALSISSIKVDALPLNAKVCFLPRLEPDRVKETIKAVGNIWVNWWDTKTSQDLSSFKQNYLDKGVKLPPDIMDSIDKIPGRAFMALYLYSPTLIKPFIPLMNEYQLAVTIPMMNRMQFEQLLDQPPPQYAKNSAADYLSHFTTEQQIFMILRKTH